MDFDAVAQLQVSFYKEVNILYTFLHSRPLHDVNKAPHLRQFYLRLNFNEFVGQQMVKTFAS